jgi:hypothetical protein
VKRFAKIIVGLPLKKDAVIKLRNALRTDWQSLIDRYWEKRYPTYLSVCRKGILTPAPRRVANFRNVANPCNRNCIKSEPQLYQKRTDFIFLFFIKYSKIATFTVASIFE